MKIMFSGMLRIGAVNVKLWYLAPSAGASIAKADKESEAETFDCFEINEFRLF